MKQFIFRKDVSIVITLGWMSVIFYLSHQPASTSSELSNVFVNLVLNISTIVPFSFDYEFVSFIIRKGAHFFTYLMLGIFVFHTVRLWICNRVLSSLYSFLIAVIYAIFDEYHQTFIPGRSGEVKDVLIDSAGSLTGIALYLIIILWYKKGNPN